MDLDGFKQINDRYGHAVGDLVLRETAHRQRANVRESDLVFKIGGSEEIVVGIAGKIIAAVSEPTCHQELTLNVTISLGIDIYPLHATDIASLIELSERAMYQQAGSNCFRMGKPENA
jgi:diguanylate cyclase (GGDEF)-like protein